MSEPRRELFHLSVFYFGAYGGLGGFMPFLPLVLSRRGLSPGAISLVMILIPITNILVPPLWGLLADALGARVAMMRASALGCAAAALAMIPDLGFAGGFAAVAAFCFFRAPLFPLADAASHAVLGEDRARFASVRVWGSVGFAGFVVGAGLIEASSEPLRLFGMVALAYALAAFAAGRLPSPAFVRRRGVFKDLLAHLRGSSLPLLFGATTLYYYGHGSYDIYFALHLRALGFGDPFIGAAWGFGVACEVSLMLFTPRLLQHGRPAIFLLVSSAVAVVRWFVLGELTSGGWILLAQALHAVTFGLWYLSLVKLVQDRSPDALRTSVQGWTIGSMALGGMIGFLAGGQLFEQGGGSWVFRAAGGVALLSALGYGALLARDRASRLT